MAVLKVVFLVLFFSLKKKKNRIKNASNEMPELFMRHLNSGLRVVRLIKVELWLCSGS